MSERKYRKINFDCRKEIEAYYGNGYPISVIAKKLNIPMSTLYLEIARGSNGTLNDMERKEYNAVLAETVYQENIHKRGRGKY